MTTRDATPSAELLAAVLERLRMREPMTILVGATETGEGGLHLVRALRVRLSAEGEAALRAEMIRSYGEELVALKQRQSRDGEA